jgi:FlaA1/EpsC-like NDP-sugar epimerase
MKNIIIRIKLLPKPLKVILVASADFIAVFLAWFALTSATPSLKIFVVNIGNASGEFIKAGSFTTFIVSYIVMLLYLLYFGFYRSRIGSYESKLTLLRSVLGSLIYGITYSLCLFFIDDQKQLPFLVYLFISLSCFIILYAIINFIRDIASYILYTKSINSNNKKNVLIYGAGAAGLQLLNAIKDDIKINLVGLFDDSNNIKGSEVSGYRVFGKKSHLTALRAKHTNLLVYLAIPSISTGDRQKIITKLEKLKIAVRTMPGFHELISDDKKLAEMQNLSLEDILPRSSAGSKKINFSNQNIMITGSGGSIGSELVRQIIKGSPSKVVLFEISEYNLYKIQSEALKLASFSKAHIDIVGILGDVKSITRLREVIISHKIDVIYHAAAYKHVPIVEHKENIFEGIRNNIFGTQSVCLAASETAVKKVVLISTDKAVRPTNVMGATKRMAEMVAQSFNEAFPEKNFCMVRFGNVLNSSGSVIPLFTKQIQEGGPITITHKDVTRFFMTIPEAANLVMEAGELSSGGEVFILNMGDQVKIYDLAKRLIHLSGRNITTDSKSEGIQIKEVGLRPGEKLYEELLISGKEDLTINKKILISKESFLDKTLLDGVLESLLIAERKHNTSKAIEILENSVEGYKQDKGVK